MIAKHVLNIHRTAGNAPERDDTDKKVPAVISLLVQRAAVGLCREDITVNNHCITAICYTNLLAYDVLLHTRRRRPF